MAKYRIDIAASVRAYGSVTIEAATIEAANAIADRMVRQPANDEQFPALDPEWDTLFDCEALNVTPVGD